MIVSVLIGVEGSDLIFFLAGVERFGSGANDGRIRFERRGCCCDKWRFFGYADRGISCFISVFLGDGGF